MNWPSALRGKVLFREPLSRHTSFKIGPDVSFWIEPFDLEELKNLVSKLKSLHSDYFVIGNGSKLLINKKIPNCIHLGGEFFNKVVVRGNNLVAGSGVSISKLIDSACKNNLGGLEFLSGIPASLGGAVVKNAGVSWPDENQIGDLVESVLVLDRNGKEKVLTRKDLRFVYRSSGLRGSIVVSAKLRLHKKKRSEVISDSKKFLDYRKKTQDLKHPSAGCIFKNPCNDSAGRLIDSCGLKGMRIGDAAISTKHANFIINEGCAKALDVLRLITFIKKEVKKKFGVELELEIEVI